jgi:branched-chain amino acid transport system substrate-binding protein
MSGIYTSANRRSFLVGATASVASFVAPAVLRAQGSPLKIGVLLPRSGLQAGLGQDCQRAVDIAPGILLSLGLPDLAVMNGDTESNVDTARARAEQLIGSGAQLLIGAFDSGQTTAIAQVAEQKGIPLVINIAAAPAITEQGYRFVFRNFPTAQMILAGAFAAQKRSVRRRRRGAQNRRLHARQRHLRLGDGQRNRRRHAEIRHALYDRRGDRLRSCRA